jgi:hypothetical protein
MWMCSEVPTSCAGVYCCFAVAGNVAEFLAFGASDWFLLVFVHCDAFVSYANAFSENGIGCVSIS